MATGSLATASEVKSGEAANGVRRPLAPRAARATTTNPASASDASRNASDDEILGLIGQTKPNLSDTERDAEADFDAEPENRGDLRAESQGEESPDGDSADAETAVGGEPEELRVLLDANPDLRQAWDDASAYREAFATPDEARNATVLLADLNRMDKLFFSRRTEDHAELARSIAELDPAAFVSFAKAMGNEAGKRGGAEAANRNASTAPSNVDARAATEQQARSNSGAGLTAAQSDFLQTANAAAVQGVVGAIEAQVGRLLPEGASKSARNRLVGEIYRELDSTLRANRQLSQQMRDAFRSGTLDADHQRAVVSLITGRARQALPGVAKRVMNEWTSTVVTANQDRRARQRAAERRVDIGGSGGAGNEGHRTMTPRDIDYARMSDGCRWPQCCGQVCG